MAIKEALNNYSNPHIYEHNPAAENQPRQSEVVTAWKAEAMAFGGSSERNESLCQGLPWKKAERYPAMRKLLQYRLRPFLAFCFLSLWRQRFTDLDPAAEFPVLVEFRLLAAVYVFQREELVDMPDRFLRRAFRLFILRRRGGVRIFLRLRFVSQRVHELTAYMRLISELE